MQEYNANRPSLILREYGRNLQKLVQQINALENRDTRTKHAQALIKLMGVLDTNGKSQAESLQKRWDDLSIMSDYTLDVDRPYPAPVKGATNQEAQRLPYVQGAVKFRSYGRNIECLIQKAAEATDPTLQEQMLVAIVKLMKNFSNTWNRDNIDCNTILIHLQQLAGNRLTIDQERLKAYNLFQNNARDKNKPSKGAAKRRKTS